MKKFILFSPLLLKNLDMSKGWEKEKKRGEWRERARLKIRIILVLIPMYKYL